MGETDEISTTSCKQQEKSLLGNQYEGCFLCVIYIYAHYRHIDIFNEICYRATVEPGTIKRICIWQPCCSHGNRLRLSTSSVRNEWGSVCNIPAARWLQDDFMKRKTIHWGEKNVKFNSHPTASMCMVTGPFVMNSNLNITKSECLRTGTIYCYD